VENLRENAAKDPRVRVVMISRSFGVFRSSLNWLRYATGDTILCMPPVDPQDPPEHLPESVRLWESGYDVAAGARSTRGENLALRTSRKMFYRIFNSLSDFDLSPDLREFQLSDHKVLKAVLSHNDHYPYIRGIIASAGFKKVIIPYTWKARKRGVSKHNLIMMIDHALNAIFAFTKVSVKAVTGSRNVASLALHKA
jgi:glycosyltransferase involved in cell wall biosynthesis